MWPSLGKGIRAAGSQLRAKPVSSGCELRRSSADGELHPTGIAALERWRLGSRVGIRCRETLENSRRIKRIIKILCGAEAAV